MTLLCKHGAFPKVLREGSWCRLPQRDGMTGNWRCSQGGQSSMSSSRKDSSCPGMRPEPQPSSLPGLPGHILASQGQWGTLLQRPGSAQHPGSPVVELRGETWGLSGSPGSSCAPPSIVLHGVRRLGLQGGGQGTALETGPAHWLLLLSCTQTLLSVGQSSLPPVFGCHSVGVFSVVLFWG